MRHRSLISALFERRYRMPKNALEALDIRRTPRGFGQVVAQLHGAAPISLDHFDHQRQRFEAEIVGEIRAPAKAHPDTAGEVVCQLDNGAQVEPIAEDDEFVTRVNAVPLIEGDGLFPKRYRIAR